MRGRKINVVTIVTILINIYIINNSYRIFFKFSFEIE
jgi:hypothetical protein